MLDTSGCSSLRRLGFQTNAQGLKIHILTIWSWHMSAHVVGSSFFSPFNREHGNTDTHGLPTIPSWPLDGEKSPAFGMGKEYCEVINHGKRKSSKNGGVRGNSTINGCLFVHCHVWPLEGSRVVPLPPEKNRGTKRRIPIATGGYSHPTPQGAKKKCEWNQRWVSHGPKIHRTAERVGWRNPGMTSVHTAASEWAWDTKAFKRSDHGGSPRKISWGFDHEVDL